jgi:hypothetical protein
MSVGNKALIWMFDFLDRAGAKPCPADLFLTCCLYLLLLLLSLFAAVSTGC